MYKEETFRSVDIRYKDKGIDTKHSEEVKGTGFKNEKVVEK